MNHKVLLVAIFSLASSSLLAAGFDTYYLAVGGDMDADGDIDVLVKHAPEIVLLRGEDVAGDVSDTVLVNNGDGTFSMNALSQLSQATQLFVLTWQTEIGSLKIGDFNNDGAFDGYLDLPESNFNGAVDDVILFASPSGTGMPIALTRVDTEFHEFFDQLVRWGQDPNYFKKTAIEKGWYHYEGTEIVYDYSGFNQNALALAHGALKNAVAAGGIVAGSSDAESIADVLEKILGVTIYGGEFRDSSVVLIDEQDMDEGIN